MINIYHSCITIRLFSQSLGTKGIHIEKVHVAIIKAFHSLHRCFSFLFLCSFLLKVYIAIFISVMTVPLNKQEIKCDKTPVSHFLVISLKTREPNLHYLGAR